jgi:hypothetical protein
MTLMNFRGEKDERYKEIDAAKRAEEENPEFIAEQKRMLDQRIAIAENSGNKYNIWQQSPSRDHDKDFFDKDKTNIYGQLSWNDTEKSKKSHKKSKKKKSKKKSKKHKKRKSSSESSGSELSDMEEVNIDNIKRLNTSDEEDMEEMIHDQKKKISKRLKEAQKLEEVGPLVDPTKLIIDSKNSKMDFGKALMPGEGAAMAKFVEEGKRIPRRGEIGLTTDEIVKFETSGYVMSGSRHRRMEAVRLRKENQVYSADEKRALANFNHEVRSKKEEQLMTQFRELVHSKQKVDH